MPVLAGVRDPDAAALVLGVEILVPHRKRLHDVAVGVNRKYTRSWPDRGGIDHEISLSPMAPRGTERQHEPNPFRHGV